MQINKHGLCSSCAFSCWHERKLPLAWPFFFKVHEIQVLIHLLFTFVTVSVYKALSIPYISKHCLYFQLLFQMSAPLGPLLCNLQFPLSSGRCLYTTRRSVASSKSKKRTFKEANTDKSAVELNSDQKCFFFFPLVCFFSLSATDLEFRLPSVQSLDVLHGGFCKVLQKVLPPLNGRWIGRWLNFLE